jgi:copper chaperone CopZ
MGKAMTFSVTGMTCDNCVHHVTEAIKNVAGVTATQVTLATNSAKVEGEFDEKAIIAAVEEEGYEAKVAVSG